jgi:hypothetical protein
MERVFSQENVSHTSGKEDANAEENLNDHSTPEEDEAERGDVRGEIVHILENILSVGAPPFSDLL